MRKARLSLIAAVARNGVIGAADKLPWRLSTDMQRFKQLTLGKPVIVGRKTFDSIGKPLAGRFNIVLTHDGRDLPDDVLHAPNLDAAIAIARLTAETRGVDEVMVIGGGMIYAAAIGRAERLYITHVEAEPVGDVSFPPIDPAVWHGVSSEPVPAGEKDSAATTYVVYERRGSTSAG